MSRSNRRNKRRLPPGTLKGERKELAAKLSRRNADARLIRAICSLSCEEAG